ncbi:glycosyltransferase family 4 protein [Nocardioides piscis]|uniref:Glycosyltransferase family 4 protein n=1 Tax=Nocardioides piscis TaxID=2714938 RepID=A0A6G7YET6_9ACTN|nr:glycosyltransferase family 4 protein [Nocardioides piscis]QIK75239.1 glycosyltransferase family 4 protein [Nocardioides piscis]
MKPENGRVLMMTGEVRENGLTRHVLQLASALKAQGWTVAIALDSSLASSEWFVRDAEHRGLTTYQLGFSRQGVGLVRSGAALAAGYLDARAMVEEFNPTVIHCHTRSTLPYALLASGRGRSRVVFSVHNTIANTAVTKILYRIPQKFVATSEAIEVDLLEGFGVPARKVHYVPNGVESTTPDFEPVSLDKADLEACDEGLVLVAMGRLDEAKGFDVLIDAAAILQADADMPHFHVVIVGEGEERPDLERRCRETHTQDIVHLVGWRSDIAEVFDASDVFVLSSRWEGFPLVVVDAMLRGLPVVRTAVSGKEQVVHGETGFLVQPDDAVALAARLKELASSSKTRKEFGEAGRARAEALYTTIQMASATGDIYRTVAGK